MISTIRDYLDVLSGILNTSHSSVDIIQATFLFFFQSTIQFFQWIVTFGWFRDILYLPILLPKWQQSILSMNFLYEDLHLTFFETAKSELGFAFKPLESTFGLFLLGFFNSFFCCLPFSTTHLLAFRRLFVQGVMAGITSTAAIILGQWLFITLTVFGVRSAIIPWLSMDPLNWILGVFCIFIIVYEMTNEKRIRAIDSSETTVLRRIFALSFVLTWTEQATISQYLINITFSNQASLLTLPQASLGGASSSWICQFSYCLGIFIGHIFFSALFIGLALFIKNRLFTLFNFPYSVLLKRTNSLFLVGILGLSLSSVPYYSFDYLITGPLGMISQDKIMDQSIFPQRNIKDPSRLLTGVDVLIPFPIDTDISYFDRADYNGDQPGFFKRHFEELNYQGEYAWFIRRDKKPNLYSSNQPTRTAIRDLFQFETPSSNSSSSEQSSDSDPAHLPLNKNQEQKGSLEEKKFSYQARFNQKLKGTGKSDLDRYRLKKRYQETYEENRANESVLIGESFHSFPSVDKKGIPPLETDLKTKYYTNRVYQTLLNLEIDAFLNRQPNSYKLTEEEENTIFQKRYLLNKYYDTIRAYQQLPYRDEFNEFFQGSKTFVDRAYNHQFKGSLHILRRLFAVTLDKQQNPKQASVIKYDQPLFRTNDQNPFVHEELALTLESDSDFDEVQTSPQTGAIAPLVPYIDSLQSDSSASAPLFVAREAENSPFLELSDSTPFYLGWDNETRQMVLTKRFIPQPESPSIHIALNQFPATKKLTDSQFKAFLKKSKEDTDGEIQEQRTLTLTTWPLQKDLTMALKSQRKNQVSTLFEPTSNPEMATITKILTSTRSGTVEVLSFPINFRYFSKTPDNLAPSQGGFLWPGSQYLFQKNSVQDETKL